jgi:tRNA/rRNA methyltransferase
MSARVVLVRPRNPLNIGAAARAMANFGLDDMVVVRPWAPVWRETVSAVGAEKLVLAARAVGSLEEAVEGCSLVLGTTVLRDRRVERDVVRLPDLGDYVKKRTGGEGKTALVFGSEKTGLSTAYLEKCHAWVTVPTDPKTPSMNLSHAVAVCCYELARGAMAAGAPSPSVPVAPAQELELLARHAAKLFDAAGYLTFLTPARRMSKIRRALLQWNIRATDVGMLHGIMRFLENKAPGIKRG